MGEGGMVEGREGGMVEGGMIEVREGWLRGGGEWLRGKREDS